METKRLFSTRVSTFLIAAATITDSAIEHTKELEANDATINKSFLGNLRSRIDMAIKKILGADNAKALRKSTADLLNTHTQAQQELGLTKILLENKYAGDPARRDELLNTLGFNAHYLLAAKGIQEDMGQLLSRFNENFTPALEAELITKGLPKTRIAALRNYASIYTHANTAGGK